MGACAHLSTVRLMCIRLLLVAITVFPVMWGLSGKLIECLVSVIDTQIITVTPYESFTSHLLLAVYIELLVMFPYMVAELYRFVSPGLYDNEKRTIKIGVPALYLSFVVGATIPAYYMTKLIMGSLSQYLIGGVNGFVTLSSYIELSMCVSVVMGLVCCIPVVSGGLAYARLLKSAVMSCYVKHFVVIALVFSAILTPPDVMSMLLLAIPMVALYLVSIQIVKVIEKVRC